MANKKNTLSQFTASIRRKYAHVDELASLRDSARKRVASMLAILNTARKHASLSQTQVAERLGVSQSTVSRWEKGTEEISLRDFVFFMQACNEKIALVAAPANARFSDEDMARSVVKELIGQLYPDLDVDEVFPAPSKNRATRSKPASRPGTKEQVTSNEVLQARMAARAVSSSFNSLGYALDRVEEDMAG